MNDIRKKKTAALVIGGWVANAIGTWLVSIGGIQYGLTSMTYQPQGAGLLAVGVLIVAAGMIALLYGVYLALEKVDRLADKFLDAPVEDAPAKSEEPTLVREYVDPNTAEVEEL